MGEQGRWHHWLTGSASEPQILPLPSPQEQPPETPRRVGHGAQMQNTQQGEPPNPARLFPREQRGSEGVTRSRCPARCQQPRGSASQPGRWLPSAPGTSCRRRSPAVLGEQSQTIPNPRQPQSCPSPAGLGTGSPGMPRQVPHAGRGHSATAVPHPSCCSPPGSLKSCESFTARAVSPCPSWGGRAQGGGGAPLKLFLTSGTQGCPKSNNSRRKASAERCPRVPRSCGRAEVAVPP